MSDVTKKPLEWCSAPPSGWSRPRVKALFHDDTGNITVEELSELHVDHYSIPAFDEFRAPTQESGSSIASNKTRLRGGELLFSKLNSHKPRVWLVPRDENTKVASTEFVALREWHRGTVDLRFARYLLGSAVFADYISCFQTSVTNSHKRINPEDLWRTRIPLPSLAEQEHIAAYLDASCLVIDAAVSAKRLQLKVLDELRTTTVAHAVTLGLDRGAKMRPSGLDWLQEVPSHWQVQQIKRNCSLVRGQFTHRPRNDPALYDGPYPFVQTGDITAAGKYIRTYSQTLNELGLSVSKRFPKGTLVMSIAANIGDVAILDFEACFPDSMIGMIPGHKTNLDFLYYLMRAMRGILLRSAVLSTQLNLNYVRIGTNFAPFPPVHEQAAIAEFLDEKEREFQAIIATIEAQIDSLTAYRRSLIHECVTGQRRIAEADLNRVKAHAQKEAA